MSGFARSIDQPEDTTQFPNGEEHVVHVAGTPIGLATFQPGWRWSNDLRPMMGTDRCPIHHVGYALTGHLHVELADGSTLDVAPGDVFDIPSEHDAWVVGEEPVTLLDWGGKARDSAKPADQAAGGMR
jgi:hypothetical protein